MMRQEDEIVITFVYPPIPDRNFDWSATWDNDEPDDNGQMLHGHGRTPLDAIRDLLDSTEIHEEIVEEYAAKGLKWPPRN